MAVLCVGLGTIFVTSCGSDKEDPEVPVVITTENIEFLVAVGPNQNKHFEQTFTFKVGPNTLIIPISDMTEVKDITKYVEYKAALDKAITMMSGLSTTDLGYKVYKYNLGTIQTGQSVKAMDYSYTLMENRPSESNCYVNMPVLIKVGKEEFIANTNNSTIVGDIPTSAEGINILCNKFYKVFMNVSYIVK